MFIKYLIPIYVLYIYNLLYYTLKYKTLLVSPKSFLNNVQLGEKVMICGGVKMDNCIIGDYSYISGAETGGIISRFTNVKIGKFCSIAHNVDIINHSHYTNHISSYPFYNSKNSPFLEKDNMVDILITNTQLGNDVWIGAHVKIIGNIKIGDGAIIAAGSVVTKDIPPYTIYGGVPAKFIRNRFSKEFINYLLELRWWEKDLTSIKNNLEFLNGEEGKKIWKN